MRLKPDIKAFIKQNGRELFPEAEIYLFGSRLNDHEKGGDIDLLLLSDKKIDTKQIRKFRIRFFKSFGWQKIDLVNFTREERSTFKNLVLTNAQAI
ncbi:nucleotidyltransferase domain-containing protein [Mangrovibacterium marinum]|uniref:Nucleotidyltransferase-like protein n=1 Tax=Mangrovibacterium marinum TaxID=1639118 RepID=A0A2T5BSC6_9BACT|nr:nucleotidyltransferase domain-containing protein [Mangrovibacterium marinum]PTN02228.1 nucleotidyltransferase-like protein [Mangrovibacterium marinum]